MSLEELQAMEVRVAGRQGGQARRGGQAGGAVGAVWQPGRGGRAGMGFRSGKQAGGQVWSSGCLCSRQAGGWM